MLNTGLNCLFFFCVETFPPVIRDKGTTLLPYLKIAAHFLESLCRSVKTCSQLFALHDSPILARVLLYRDQRPSLKPNLKIVSRHFCGDISRLNDSRKDANISKMDQKIPSLKFSSINKVICRWYRFWLDCSNLQENCVSTKLALQWFPSQFLICVQSTISYWSNYCNRTRTCDNCQTFFDNGKWNREPLQSTQNLHLNTHRHRHTARERERDKHASK